MQSIASGRMAEVRKVAPRRRGERAPGARTSWRGERTIGDF